MANNLVIEAKPDHIESQTVATPTKAILELIWNALDADATIIDIQCRANEIGTCEHITIEDNGHGLDFEKAKKVFESLGGSSKAFDNLSPGGRLFHGKLGKGRLKSFSLGKKVEFISTYLKEGRMRTFNIVQSIDSLKYAKQSEESFVSSNTSGFKVKIFDVEPKHATALNNPSSILEIKEALVSYSLSYNNFTVRFNDSPLNLDDLIAKSIDRKSTIIIEEKAYPVTIRIIEFTSTVQNRIFLCNEQGIPLQERSLKFNGSKDQNICIFIQTSYFEELNQNDMLGLPNAKISALEYQAKSFGKEYVLQKKYDETRGFIDKLKRDNIYPYRNEKETNTEKTSRQVFDIVAYQLHTYLPDFDEQDINSKKLTLALIKEAIEKDSKSLNKILSEVIELPEDKREDLAGLLEHSPLTNIIDTVTMITNRLLFITALEKVIYDSETNKKVLERRHLHKILINETWIFGEEYAYGVDDITLRKVLLAYCEHLGRESLAHDEIEVNPSGLDKIPDICLWRSFPDGSPEKKSNLIVELKRPGLIAGFKEFQQITQYANTVANDPRFPKENTRWKFVLLVNDIKEHELNGFMIQNNREYGHVLDGENCDVYIIKWGSLLAKAKARLEFLRESMNIEISEESKSVAYLKQVYNKYLPEDYCKE